MASEGVIAELLRQAFQERNGPSSFDRGVGSVQEVMKGISQGIQLYDQMKGLKGKYGHTVTTPGTPEIPGTPGMPAQPTATGVQPGGVQLPNFSTNATPGFPQPQPLIPGTGFPGTPGTPATPGTSTFVPGTADLERIQKAAEVSPDLARSTAARMGVNIGTTNKELQYSQDTPVISHDAEGNQVVTFVKGKRPVIDTSGTEGEKIKIQMGLLAIKGQELDLAKATAQERIREFEKSQLNSTDKAEAERRRKLAEPFTKVLTDKKFNTDKQAIDFASDVIREINLTGEVPEATIEKSKLWGFDIPGTGKKTVKEKSAATPAAPGAAKARVNVRKKNPAGNYETFTVPEDQVDQAKAQGYERF